MEKTRTIKHHCREIFPWGGSADYHFYQFKHGWGWTIVLAGPTLPREVILEHEDVEPTPAHCRPVMLRAMTKAVNAIKAGEYE